MRPHNSVFHVRTLEEALTLYARERVAGRANPTFTVDAAQSAYFAECAAKSYTVRATHNGQPVLLRRVLLHFTPINSSVPEEAHKAG